MQIIFGLEYDGGSYPDELFGDDARLGVIHVGPLGLMELLETRLGVGDKPISATLRIGQYLQRIQALSGNHFFKESLKADSWATAKHLLDWRDALILGGWDKRSDDMAPDRIKSLALLEQASDSFLAAGFGERIMRIQSCLEKGAAPGIFKIVCIEPFKLLPFYWQKIFQLMGKSGCIIEQAKPIEILGSSTDLDALKQGLKNTRNEAPAVTGDGSVALLSCANEFDGASFLAGWLSAKQDVSDILWITGGGSPILDNRLNACGLPRLSTDRRSKWRTILQVLPLAFAVRWKPFDPQLFLEWLSLPQLPFPSFLAFGFRKALLRHPGRGGPLWKAAREKCLSEKSAGLKDEDFAGSATEYETASLEQVLDFWFDMESHDPETGMPVEEVTDVCKKIAGWAIARGKKTGDPLFISAGALATEFAETVSAGGQEKVTKPQLDRILDYIYANGYKNTDDICQAADWSSVSSPGQARGPAGTIIWWNFTDTQKPDSQPPWTRAERQWLKANNVIIEEPKTERLRKAFSWRQAVLCCGRQLILVCPGQVNASQVSPHPFWDEIRYLLNLDATPYVDVVWKTAGFFSKKDSRIFDFSVPKKAVSPCPPPGFEPVWETRPGMIAPRPEESFSSMDRLIRCPRAWVMQYILKLEPPTSLSVPDGNQAAGTLAHKIVEMILKQDSSISPEDAYNKTLELFDEMVPRMAATLLQPGREIEMNRYRMDMARAVFNLIKLINEAGLTYVASEVRIEKPFAENSCRFVGIIDLLLSHRDGSRVFWDLKWSKRARYRREELENNEALQLAAYSWLLAVDKDSFPPGGYYMLGQAELLSGPCNFLPPECIAGDLDLSSVWHAARRVFLKHMDELGKGRVAAGCSQDEETKGLQANELQLKARCDWCEYVHLCGENK